MHCEHAVLTRELQDLQSALLNILRMSAIGSVSNKKWWFSYSSNSSRNHFANSLADLKFFLHDILQLYKHFLLLHYRSNAYLPIHKMSTCPLWFTNRITLLYMHLMIRVTYNWTNTVRISTETRQTVGKFKSVHQSDSSFMDTHLCTLSNVRCTNTLILVCSLTNLMFKETKIFQIVSE